MLRPDREAVIERRADPVAAARARTVRSLWETTELPITDVAFVAGLPELDAARLLAGSTAPDQRAGRAASASCAPDPVELWPSYRAPMDIDATLAFLGARAIPHVETYEPGRYQRVIRAPRGAAQIELTGAHGTLRCRARVTDPRDLVAVVSRVRQLLDLDADPTVIDSCLGADDALGTLVARHPGLRSPGAVDGFEMAVRAVVGQQISVRGARTILGRITAEHGTPAFDPPENPPENGASPRLFPSAGEFATIDPDWLPMPRSRARTLLALAAACASGDLCLDPDTDREHARAVLLALPGIGPWTADYVQMRAMGDPDILLATDLGVRKSAEQLGVSLRGGRPDWAPWRSYATHHFWAAH